MAQKRTDPVELQERTMAEAKGTDGTVRENVQ